MFHVPHLDSIIRSIAHCKCSQLLQVYTSRHTHTKVPNMCRRLRISGAENLAAVETHTKITVTMASMMLMHFPSSTLASALSNCKTCCCCCCNSNLLTRVWQTSKASCGDEEKEMQFTFSNLIGQAAFQKVLLIFKGIVHPKMKILSLITHPHVVPNPVRHLQKTN